MRGGGGGAAAVEVDEGSELDSGGPQMSAGEIHDAPENWGGIGKTGLNDSDVVQLVRAVKRGLSWDRAKRVLGGGFARGVVDGWKPEVMRRVEQSGPVLPTKPAPRAAPAPKREVLDTERELDIALAALVAGRGDLAMRVLRGLGADATAAPDGWIDILMARNDRAARREAPAAPPAPEFTEAAEAPEGPPRRARAPRASAEAPKAKGRGGRKPKGAAAPVDQ